MHFRILKLFNLPNIALFNLHFLFFCLIPLYHGYILFFQVQETNMLVQTILDVQPRMSAGGGGKSSDEIVYELAESILGKLMDKLDLENIRQDMLEVK